MSALDFAATVASRDVELAFTVNDGETLAIIGPNGSGKSTALGVIAGLVRATSGQVLLGGRDISGLPPHQRQIALLTQDPLLFPHLSALDNVAFGLRAKGVPRGLAREQSLRWLAEVGIEELAARKPNQLSGGQAQRVAVARALAATPNLLMLDEPMAALDVGVAPALRQMLRTVLANRTAIIVTHDVLDALVLADRVIVIEHGRITEQGPTAQVLSRPRSEFAARIAGLNLVAGRWLNGTVVHPDAILTGTTPEPILTPAASVVAVFAPTSVAVYPEAAHGSPRNTFAGTITEIEPFAGRVKVHSRVGALALSAEITPAAASELDLTPGATVYLSVKATEVTIFEAGSPAP
ncbi:MAG: ABC transporter ATP-binding protein [Propionibacteriaceae bacterium]|jgi:molybdopterin-binding protein|nr:ABC transporter ATP-binding protein [Propionibacteriaceae bacterium]